MPAEPPVDPPPDDDLVPPQFCPDCRSPIGDSHGCECERIEVRVLVRLEDTSS